MATGSNQNDVALLSVGIDIGKEVFYLAGFVVAGFVVAGFVVAGFVVAGKIVLSRSISIRLSEKLGAWPMFANSAELIVLTVPRLS